MNALLRLGRIFAFSVAVAACTPQDPDRSKDAEPGSADATPGSAMSFSIAHSGGNCPDCVWIAASGEITADTAEQLQAFLTAQGGEASLVAFDSPGGDLVAGVAMGQLLRQRGLRSTVATTITEGAEARLRPGLCASACAFAFVGGTERTLFPGSQFGVHQFRNEALGDRDTQSILAGLAAHLQAVGVSRDLLMAASGTPPEAMYWVPVAELEALNVITTRSQLSEAQWTVSDMGDFLALMSDQQQPNGQTTRFYVACNVDLPDNYILAFAKPLNGMDEATGSAAAGQVDGFTFSEGGRDISAPYGTSGTAGEGAFWVLAPVPRAHLQQIATWPNAVTLALTGVPRASEPVFGASRHLFPRSNLLSMLHHLDRNCIP